MLSIIFGYPHNAVMSVDDCLGKEIPFSFIQSDFAKRVIKEIDKSEVMDNGMINSSALGIIPPSVLSGGAKALFMLHELEDIIMPINFMGDNCLVFLKEILEFKSITICMGYLNDLFDYGINEMFIVNSNKIVRDGKSFAYEFLTAEEDNYFGKYSMVNRELKRKELRKAELESLGWLYEG